MAKGSRYRKKGLAKILDDAPGIAAASACLSRFEYGAGQRNFDHPAKTFLLLELLPAWGEL
jgi:hypothetical protein